jgi:hypothetical protein
MGGPHHMFVRWQTVGTPCRAATTASSIRELSLSLSKTWRRRVLAVRGETKSRSGCLAIGHPLHDEAHDRQLGVRQRGPAVALGRHRGQAAANPQGAQATPDPAGIP